MKYVITKVWKYTEIVVLEAENKNEAIEKGKIQQGAICDDDILEDAYVSMEIEQ